MATTEELRAMKAQLEDPNLFGLGRDGVLAAYIAALEERALTEPTFTRSQLRDGAFFAANRQAIYKAAAEGRIVDDLGGQIAPNPEQDAARARARRQMTGGQGQ